MTMLDRMRRHRSWLKWSLALVVLCFVLLYIPSFMRDTAQGASNGAVVADGRRAADYGRPVPAGVRPADARLSPVVRRERDEKLLKQLGIDQRIVQQMVEEEAAFAEARRLGISASDAEVRERILALPAFQENGQFIGDDRYRQLLRMQRRRCDPTNSRSRSAAASRSKSCGGADRLADGERRRVYAGGQEAEREGEARGALLPRRQDSATTCNRLGRGGRRRTSRTTKTIYRVPEKRKVAIPDHRSGSDARQGVGHGPPRSSAPTTTTSSKTDAGTGSGEPHPAQDRRQGRRRREKAGGRDSG